MTAYCISAFWLHWWIRSSSSLFRSVATSPYSAQSSVAATMLLTFILGTCVILQLQIILLLSNAFSNNGIKSISRCRRHLHETSPNNVDTTLDLFRRGQSTVKLGSKATANNPSGLHKFSSEYNDTMIDQYFMDAALRQAQLALSKEEVPIGAIIVEEIINLNTTGTTQERSFRLISEAHNLVETNFDASAHAEMLALRKGAQILQNWRYPPNSTLYSTLEPCPMCLASAQAFRLDRIVYGAPDNRLGAIKTHMNLMDVAKHPYHDVKSVVGGVRAEECGSIMVNFFRERRRMKRQKETVSQGIHDGDPPRRSKMKRIRFDFIKKLVVRMLGSQ